MKRVLLANKVYLEKQKIPNQNLRRQNHRQPGLKRQLPRFMAKETHAQQNARGAADKRQNPKRHFFDTAMSELGFEFVQADVKKGGYINGRAAD